MAIPDYETLMLPLLRLVAAGPKAIRDIVKSLEDEFKLSDEERQRMLPSGRQTFIANRTHWAKTYLKQAGVVGQPGRGVVSITKRGRDLLLTKPIRIDYKILSQYPEFLDFRSRRNDDFNGQPNQNIDENKVDSSLTPEERIASASAELNEILGEDILARIKSAPPSFFEKVVLDLLAALGYGLPGETASLRTGGTGDGGIDGVIEEDRLGLERIYVQAKRYANQAVTAHDVRSFSGALDDKGARKGVFVTTSGFSRDAVAYAERQQHKRMVLIDGDRLADLMIRHGVGVRTDRTVEIKKVDLDYFEPDEA